MMPPTGFLAGRFGVKRVFLISVAGFTVALMLCGMAQSLAQIVCFRMLQGMFGAALVPLTGNDRRDMSEASDAPRHPIEGSSSQILVEGPRKNLESVNERRACCGAPT
jgi:hypothetical protein